MARPPKVGLDYFPLDVALDTKFDLLEAEFGLPGFAIIIKLFQEIYGKQGYYINWGADVELMFAKKINASFNLVSEVVKAALRRDIFDKNLFELHQILTSRGVQKRFLEVASRQEQGVIDARYRLVFVDKTSVNATITPVNATITKVIASNNATKERKRKENKIEREQLLLSLSEAISKSDWLKANLEAMPLEKIKSLEAKIRSGYYANYITVKQSADKFIDKDLSEKELDLMSQKLSYDDL